MLVFNRIKGNEMKKINKYLTALICAFLLFAFGCSETFLDEKALTFYSEDNFYTSPKAMDLGLVTLYSNAYEYLIVNQRESFYECWVLGTDVAECAFPNTRAVSLRNAGYTNEWNAINVSGVWIYSYKALNVPNVMLSHVDKIKWDTDAQKGRIKGNALFFRALWNFYLVQAYGDIPLLTEPVATAKTDFIRNPKSEVVAQIVQDLTEAVNILPELGTYQGEIGKGAAQHLLTNVYLYNGEWAKAEQTATSLISSGTYHLMTERFGINKNQPGTPFTDLFFEGNINRWEGNNEILFSLQASDNYQNKGLGHYLKTCWLNNYDAVPGFKQSMDYWQRGKYYYRPSAYFLNLFDINDDRGSEFAIKRTWQFNNAAYIAAQKAKGTPLTQVVRGETVEVQVGDTAVITSANINNLYPQLTKFNDVMGTNANEANSDKDITFMRLAETYLFRAEARFRQGNLSGSADDINSLRRRAHAPEISDADVNLDLILDERARELTGEENRRFTLMRTGKLIERNLLYNPSSVGNISEKHNLFPIPQVEIDRMKDSPNFKQNPGY